MILARRIILTFLALASFSTFAQQPSTLADEISRRAVDVLAGGAWEKARYFAFTFVQERDGKRVASFAQRWDRISGDYRVAGRDQLGRDFVVIMNTNTKQGKAWLNGFAAADKDLQDLLTLGYRRFLNDTYWLLMPLKMSDPAAKKTAEGERSDACGRVWDVVHLTFTPAGGGNAEEAWAHVQRDTGIVERWDMKLQGSVAAVQVLFHDFRRVGGLLISTRREVVGKNQTVRLDDLQVAADVPKGAWD